MTDEQLEGLIAKERGPKDLVELRDRATKTLGIKENVNAINLDEAG